MSQKSDFGLDSMECSILPADSRQCSYPPWGCEMGLAWPGWEVDRVLGGITRLGTFRVQGC